MKTYLVLCLTLTLIACGPSQDGKRISDANCELIEALDDDTKELMDLDTAGDAADGMRPEQDIRDESNPTEGTTKDC